jgi:hypothetical protein
MMRIKLNLIKIIVSVISYVIGHFDQKQAVQGTKIKQNGFINIRLEAIR